MRPDETPRGELNLRAARGAYEASRWLPSKDLSSFTLYYWLVSWDRVGQPPYDQEVLTQPYVHVVFERDDFTGRTASRVVGVRRSLFTRRLVGRGRVVGIALQPGAAAQWLGLPASELAERAVPLQRLLAVDVASVEAEVLGPDDEAARVASAERFVRARARAPTKTRCSCAKCSGVSPTSPTSRRWRTWRASRA